VSIWSAANACGYRPLGAGTGIPNLVRELPAKSGVDFNQEVQPECADVFQDLDVKVLTNSQFGDPRQGWRRFERHRVRFVRSGIKKRF